MIKVLIVEDSPTARDYLVHIFSSDPGMKVIGTAKDGAEAVKLAERLNPDVITMDIHMPVMDGLAATRRIMETHPVPIVIVSGIWDPRELETTFRAIEAGALAVVERPAGIGHPESERLKEELISKVKLMSEVKVVRRWGRSPKIREEKKTEKPAFSITARQDIGIVAMGASTGGPLVLQTILSKLPPDFPVPVLIVQHIASGFIQGMLEWLSETQRPSVTHCQRWGKNIGRPGLLCPRRFLYGVRKKRIFTSSKKRNRKPTHLRCISSFSVRCRGVWGKISRHLADRYGQRRGRRVENIEGKRGRDYYTG